MTERNPYSQYNYDNYDRDPRIHDSEDESLWRRIASRFTNPLFATIALLLTGAAFAGIIVASYPGNPRDEIDVPVIHADNGDVRFAPTGQESENAQDSSTVFSSIRDNDLEEKPPAEDMLADEKPMDTLESFARETFQDDNQSDKPEETASAREITESVETPDVTASEETPEQEPVAAPEPAKTAQLEQEAAEAPPPVKDAVAAAGSGSAAIQHPPGSSPETLAFVRSVLNEKDQKAGSDEPGVVESVNTQADITQPPASRIEPAAGAATPAVSVKPGNYFAQLGSVKDESGAAAEWKRMQKTFASLSGLQYRVQRADLGAKGVFYRIQAGPMSKDNASTVCSAIKAQKPGGCIIVQ